MHLVPLGVSDMMKNMHARAHGLNAKGLWSIGQPSRFSMLPVPSPDGLTYFELKTDKGTCGITRGNVFSCGGGDHDSLFERVPYPNDKSKKSVLGVVGGGINWSSFATPTSYHKSVEVYDTDAHPLRYYIGIEEL